MSEPHVRLAGSVAKVNGTALTRARAPAFHASLPAEEPSITGMRHALLAWVDAFRDEEWRRADIELAVSEACTTVVLHAYPTGRPGLIDVSADVVDHALTVTVTDTGVGMRPRADSPGAGLGLSTLSAVSTAVVINARTTGTALLLTFEPRHDRDLD